METQTLKLISTYYRVSTSTQEENQTIQTQISAVKDFADKNGYRIVQEYADDGWSGDTLARPSLDQLRVDAKKKMWEAVLVYDPDRIARRYSYQELVMDELREAGIEVIFVTTPAPKNSEDKILHGVKGLFAEYERAKISERFRLGKLRKVKEGHILTTEALYGYNYIKKNDKVHGYYEVNEDEARVVKMIFELVANEGLTLRGIVRRLQEMEIRPRKSKRGLWATSTLTTMLRHKGYIGEAHWGKSYAIVPENPIKNEKYKKQKKTSRRDRPESEWYIIPIPAIIDKKLFERARKRLDENFALSKRNKRNDYLLAGKLWCTCGSRRCGCGPKSGRYLYYRCNDRIKQFPLPAQCDIGGIDARIADKLVWQKISTLIVSPDLMLKQIERWSNNRKGGAISSVGSVDDLEKEKTKLKEQEERYNKAYGAGLIDISQLKDYSLPIRERVKFIESEVSKLKQDGEQAYALNLPNQVEVENFAREALISIQDLSFELKREIVMGIVDKAVSDRERLQVYGHISLDNVLFCSKYRYSWSAKRRKEYAIQRAHQKGCACGELSVLYH